MGKNVDIRTYQLTRTEAYSEPSQAFTMELLAKNSERLKAVTYFRKMLHLRYLIGF